MGVADCSWIGISGAFDSIVNDAPNKITVKLKQAVPVALLELTIVRPVRMLSPKAASADGKQTAPIGTGPWIVEKYSSTETILVRNDKYWGEKPTFARMELKVVPDKLARANALRAGELDVIGGDWVAPLSPRRAKALVGASTPNFFVAAMLVIVFAVGLRWVPSFGVSGPESWFLPWVTRRCPTSPFPSSPRSARSSR